MNSAARPGIAPRANDPSPWDVVRRIYRRTCELRAAGRLDEAIGLEESELGGALASARATGEPAAGESALLAAEETRVADARLLAELIAPLLAGRLRGTAAANGAAHPAARSAPIRPQPGVSPGIADLIDGMLAQAAAASEPPA